MTAEAPPLEALTDDEKALACILMDECGLELAEFSWVDEANSARKGHHCYRCYPYQWMWWRCPDHQQLDQCARSVGKSERIKARVNALPFNHQGQEMVLIAPEGKHVDAITNRIEAMVRQSNLLTFMLIGESWTNGIGHRPFQLNFQFGTFFYTRLPGKKGTGVKGIHPVILECDECFAAGTLVLCKRGLVPIEDVIVGDQVLTHRRRWRKVTATAERVRPTVVMSGHGEPALVCSVNHPFWSTSKFSALRRVGGRLERERSMFTQPDWKPAANMKGSWWSTPRRFPKAQIPSFRDVGDHGPQAVVPCVQDNPEFMWIVGLWIAEGSISSDGNKVCWSVHVDEAPEVLERLRALGMKAWASPVSNTPFCVNVYVSSVMLARWLPTHFGKGARDKTVPAWALGLPRALRQALLDGAIYGDGYRPDDVDALWKITTVSRPLSVGLRLLAITLDLNVSVHRSDTTGRIVEIEGRRVHDSGGFYQVTAYAGERTNFQFGWERFGLVTEVRRTGEKETLYDLTVEEDETFLADGFIVHNSQDLSDSTWNELPEVLRTDIDDVKWLVHGVSKGVRDKFYDLSFNPDWTVHRLTGMHRPDWTPEMNRAKLQLYGGHEDSEEYRRNVLGAHGEEMNRIFHLKRFMACTDDFDGSDYNEVEYFKRHITDVEVIERAGQRHSTADILDSSDQQIRALMELLPFPDDHLVKYPRGVFWAGMDVGLVGDPSEIVVAVEYEPSAEERSRDAAQLIAVPDRGLTRLKVLARIRLKMLPNPLQVEVVMAVIDHYRPKAFSMDGTGIGLPLWHDLQQRAGRAKFVSMIPAPDATEREKLDFYAAQARAAATFTAIKSFNFSSKVLVAFDDDEAKVEALGPNPSVEDMIDKLGIFRYAKDWATDVLRNDLVDQRRIMFPHDVELSTQMNGQSWGHSQEPMDAYGNRRRNFSSGEFHILDAMRMLALGWKQQWADSVQAMKETKRRPVLDRF